VDPRRREEIKRFGAPAAFLAAVTIAVLLIKAGLNGASSNVEPAPPTVQPLTTRQTTTTRARSTGTVAARYYAIQSGDTLGSVAASQNTTVATLLRLNPGIDPQSLHVGQRIRVG